MRMRTPSPRRVSLGAMYELNLLVWPLVYGTAGHAIGVGFGVPWVGAAIAAIPGVATGLVMAREAFYDVEILAIAGLASVWFLATEATAVWFYLALCVVPWARLWLARAAAREDEPDDQGRDGRESANDGED